MHTRSFGDYRIFLSDRTDGAFHLRDRLPIFSDWIVADQIHEDGIAVLDAIEQIGHIDLTWSDGFAANISGVKLGVKLADCNGIILLWQTWYAVVHAGWKGLRAGIIERAIRMLVENGEVSKNLSVFCSPSIRVCCYEVADEFVEYFPGYCIRQENGRYHLEMIGCVRDILSLHGISEDQIHVHPSCTRCDGTFYSYRREKTDVRFVFGVEKIK